jgi:lysophospholipase L1-like esterase
MTNPPIPAQTLRRSVFRILTVLGATTLAFLAFEVIHRLTTTTLVDEKGQRTGSFEAHPEILIRHTREGKRLHPSARVTIRNHRLSRRNILIETNSLGFRDRELEPRRPGELRVMAIGDSITWGDYLQSDETYVEQIQFRLQEKLEPRAVEVINAGVGDVGIKEEVDILRDAVSDVEPNIVVVGFYLNDSRPPWGFSGEMGNRGWLRRNSVVADTLYRQFKLRQWVKDTGADRFAWTSRSNSLDWQHDRDAFRSLVHLARYDWGSAWLDSSWRVVEGEFLRLRKLADRHRFEVLVVVFPVSFQVYSDFVDDKPQRLLAEAAAAHEFDHMDVLPLLRQHRESELFFDHCHPRVLANALIGKAIADHLLESGLTVESAKWER